MTVGMYSDVKKPVIAFISLLGLWLVLVFASFWSAVEIWIGNEIYNHCLIVIPASIYLIYEKRGEIDFTHASMSWFALVALIGQLLLFILGGAADIQLFQHAAVFSMLPTLAWLFLGNKIAWNLQFPLVFMLFSVPVGEELIPFLQEITADMSVYMLELTGIPLFRSGLFIEIPQGKFLVAEACSGVSFLIASIVLGNLYAYMNLISWKRRLFFVGLSIVFPILANAVRVYGIIYIGYSTDMEHAVGADHLIYGWFFFAFVLVCLFCIGELVRRNEIKKGKMSIADKNVASSHGNIEKSLKGINQNYFSLSIFLLAMLLIGLTLIQYYRMDNVSTGEVKQVEFDALTYAEVDHKHQLGWEPRFMGAQTSHKYHLTDGNVDFDIYYAYFNGEGGEVASSLNRLYEQDRWTLESSADHIEGEVAIKTQSITSSIGVKREIAYWYVVDGIIATSFAEVKLLQLIQKLKGSPSHSLIIIVSVDQPTNNMDIGGLVTNFVNNERIQLRSQ